MEALENVCELKRGNVHNSGQMVTMFTVGLGGPFSCLSTMALTGKSLSWIFTEAGEVRNCRKGEPRNSTTFAEVTPSSFSMASMTRYLHGSQKGSVEKS